MKQLRLAKFQFHKGTINTGKYFGMLITEAK